MDAVKIGAFLCALRRERGWTQQEAAARLGVTDKTVSKWETARGLPDIAVLPALAALYGVTADELLAGARRAAHGEAGARRENAGTGAPAAPTAALPGGARRAFRLFALACAAEGAAVLVSGMLTALLNAYMAMTPCLGELAAQSFGDPALAADWDAWAETIAAPAQALCQHLSANLLPLALAVVLIYALARRFPLAMVLAGTLPPAAASMGLAFLLLLPLWRAPEVFLLSWPNLYLYWFLALRSTAVVYGAYLLLYFLLPRKRAAEETAK